MTKTLTEQWREGTLTGGYYYIKTRSWGCDDKWHIKKELEIDYYDEEVWSFYEDCDIYCVVAPVPSYDEYCNLMFQANKPKNPLSDVMMCYDTEREKKVVEPLQKKLAIATKALKEYNNRLNWDIRGVSFMKYNKGFTIARKALKEMEGVK